VWVRPFCPLWLAPCNLECSLELEGWRVKVETSLEEFEIREQRKAANEEARVADERKEVRYIDFE